VGGGFARGTRLVQRLTTPTHEVPVPEEKRPVDPLEALRLDLERRRYLDETTRTFLERWRTDVQPLHEHRLMSREHAYGYAKVAIQTMFLLNGGALIAFPAFAQLVETAFKDHVTFALLSIGGFVLGLLLIAITALLAYLSMGADAAAVNQKEEYVKLGLNRDRAADDDKPEYDEKRATAEKERKRKYNLATRLAWSGLALWVASLAAFVFGAIFAALVLSAVPTVPLEAALANWNG
jgi:hypothetical protein